MTMDLYYEEISPPARAVYAIVKHLGIPVQVKKIDLVSGDHHSADYLKVNPAHQVPALVDGNFILTESRAIMAYLINQFAPGHCLYPTDPKARAQIDRMLYFEGTNLYPALKATYLPRLKFKEDPTERSMEEARAAIKELIALKGDKKFLTGSEVTLADVSMAMTYTFMQLFLPEESKPLCQWYKDVGEALPVVKEINDAIDYSPLLNLLKK